MARAGVSKTKSRFFCSECGNEESRWFGHCSHCGAWNTAVEAPAESPGRARSTTRWRPGRTAAPPGPRPLAEVRVDRAQRAPTGIGELDRVLGGGVVPGSLVLVGGDPGIGKSTLLLQLATSLATQGRR